MSFQAFRSNGGPTFYEAVFIPWEADLVTSALIFCFGILAVSFYVVLPGLVGKDQLFTFIRITVSLYIGAVILVTNFAQTWETAETQTRTKYKAGTGQDVDLAIGVQIGFRGVNITLKGNSTNELRETINYNENFNWEGLQGRFGFGPFAGNIQRQYRAAQRRGLPFPILWVAEYFTLDGEGVRWGRFYRQAGWYSHIMLWLAFPLWLLANVLFCVLLRYGAYFLAMTGLSMVTANIIWATIRNPFELEIPFTDKEVLIFSYGGAFWVCLATGVACIFLGVLVFLLDKLCPSHVAFFFGVDVLQDSENILEEDEEPSQEDVRETGTITESATADDNLMANDDELYNLPPQLILPQVSEEKPYGARPLPGQKKSYRTSEQRITIKLQRPRRKDPPPVPPKPRDDSDLDEDYHNAPAIRAQNLTPAHYRQNDPHTYSPGTTIEMTGFQHR